MSFVAASLGFVSTRGPDLKCCSADYIQSAIGLSLPELKQKTIWRAGSVEEIQWALIANHGGGYQYRLCSKKPGVNPTEECFQATPIEFHGEEQYIQWCASEQQFPTNSAPAKEYATERKVCEGGDVEGHGPRAGVAAKYCPDK